MKPVMTVALVYGVILLIGALAVYFLPKGEKESYKTFKQGLFLSQLASGVVSLVVAAVYALSGNRSVDPRTWLILVLASDLLILVPFQIKSSLQRKEEAKTARNTQDEPVDRT